jgi:hypothetical protein
MDERHPDETAVRLKNLEDVQIWEFAAAMSSVADLLKLTGDETLDLGNLALIGRPRENRNLQSRRPI